MKIRQATAEESAEMERLHALCFADGWCTDAFTALLRQSNTFALVANETQEEEASGFIVVRIAADESEILTLGVSPECRGRGLAFKLVSAAADLARSKGAACLFLDVARTNVAATNLYRKLGFAQVGLRSGYYQSPGATAEDACILKAALPLTPST